MAYSVAYMQSKVNLIVKEYDEKGGLLLILLESETLIYRRHLCENVC